MPAPQLDEPSRGRAKELVADRNPREEEFSLQMRAMDTDKAGVGLGLAVLVALCGSLLSRKHPRRHPWWSAAQFNSGWGFFEVATGGGVWVAAGDSVEGRNWVSKSYLMK